MYFTLFKKLYLTSATFDFFQVLQLCRRVQLRQGRAGRRNWSHE